MGNVQKRPSGSWRARYRDPAGREHARHFGRRLDVERWLASVENAKHRGEWIDPALARITVGEWATRWLESQVQLKPLTRRRYESIVTVQVMPTWEKVKLAEVTHADVVTWVARLQAGGYAAASIRQAHRVLSLMLALAVRDRRLTYNPAEGVRLPRAARKEPHFLTHDQVDRLADACTDYELFIRLLAYTGLRWGEATALQVKRLDLIRRRLEVVRTAVDLGREVGYGTPKTHQRRSVPIPRSLVDALAEQVAGKDPDDLVFTSPRGNALRNQNFRSRSFRPAAAVIGIPTLTPHDLRHTAASLAVQAGANVKAVQRMLGHASAAMTLDVYAGLFGDDLDAVADRLDEAAARARADSLRTPAAVADVLPFVSGAQSGL
ncbi:tyrosine-type recombinase/integrase [Aeromicrobium sp.]|uniref:tyrosine-type recombinase/integrase n=1 Tax=Aeromicrobium sp. TaxID=1871063 RepID=UPI003D6A1C60